jgi:two-component system, NtrC family, nitrogen regulation sensor histidine kinase NtrY
MAIRPALVALDRAQMKQARVKICRSAIDAIGPDGVIALRVGHRAGRAFSAVEDTRPGLSDEAGAKLSTPFFSTGKGGQGSGHPRPGDLTRHGYDYSLESRPGGPTQFTVVPPRPADSTR